MIYKQTSADKGVSQIGILAALDVEDCKNNVIKRHEKTTKDVDVICTEKAKNYRVRTNHIPSLSSTYKLSCVVFSLATWTR